MKKIAVLLISALFFLISAFPVFGAVFSEQPKTIIIPSLNINLPVKETDIIFDTWEVNLEGASFGRGSDLPGNQGNTIIFAHALPQFFRRLPEIKKGDSIHVFTDHDWFTYIVTETKTVSPEHIDALKATNNQELTLFTCTGPYYSLRFIVKAELQNNTANFE